MKNFVLVPLLAVFLLAQGCVHSVSTTEYGGASYDGVSDAYPGDAADLAVFAADELAGRFPPVQTTLSLAKTHTPFGENLESALRSKGFSVSTGQDSGVTVRYTLDLIQGLLPAACYLQVRTSDGGSFGKVRELAGMAFTAAASSTPPVESKSLPEEPAPAPASPAQAPPAKSADFPSAEKSELSNEATVKESLTVQTAPTVAVHSKATAARIAKRNHVPVDEFCRFNKVTPNTVLEPGRRVFLKAPAAWPKASATAPVAKPVAVASPAPSSLGQASPPAGAQALPEAPTAGTPPDPAVTKALNDITQSLEPAPVVETWSDAPAKTLWNSQL